jgi:hypothetical protein
MGRVGRVNCEEMDCEDDGTNGRLGKYNDY